MEVLYFFLAAILCTTHGNILPLTATLPVVSPCPPQVVTSPPVVTTTIVDNSVSNALANALQLLIVSNLIENTLISPCGLNTLQTTIGPLCDAIPIQASVYNPALDIIAPEYLSYLNFDPVIAPCEYISPYESVIDIIPNVIYPEIVRYDNSFVPNIGCGNIATIGGIGLGNLPNIGSCGCGNCYSSLANILPNVLPSINLPIVGCGVNSFGYDVNAFGTLYACDQCGPIIPEVILPPAVPTQVSCSYAYGGTNYPTRVAVEPLCGLDAYPKKCVGNYYY